VKPVLSFIVVGMIGLIALVVCVSNSTFAGGAIQILDLLLKYLSVITVAGAGIAFAVGLWKYVDQRDREERHRRMETFDSLMRRVSAFGERPDDRVALTQQVAAVYELQNFPEYAYASIPILESMRKHHEKSDALLRQAIAQTHDRLKARS
jgi:hypothetical protein